MRWVMTMVAAAAVGQLGLSGVVPPQPPAAPLWCKISPGNAQWAIWGNRDAAGFWGVWSDWQQDVGCSGGGGSEYGCLFSAARQLRWWDRTSGTWQDTGYGWITTAETQQCYTGGKPAHYDWADAWRFCPRGYSYVLRTGLVDGPGGGAPPEYTNHRYDFD
jgi:hypothetical protein